MKHATNAILKEAFPIESTGEYLVELSLDNGGLPSSHILVDIKNQAEFEVKSRVLYASLKDIHQRFPFEKIKVITLKIQEENLGKLKLELIEKERKNHFQFIISPVKQNDKPYLNQEFICIQKNKSNFP